MQTSMTQVLNKSESPSNMTSELGPLRALSGMLFKPKATLSRLRDGGRVWAWLPAVLMVIVVLAATYAQSYADCYYFYEDQLHFYTQNPEHAPGRELERASVPHFTVLIRIGERLAGVLASWGMWCGGLLLASLFTGQVAVNVGASIKLTLWSWLPYVVRGALQSIYMALTHDPIFNPGLSGLVLDNTPPAMGQFEYVMIPRATRLWGTLLAYVDIYLLWQLILLWIGLPLLTKLPRKWRGVTLAVITLLWLALHVWLDFSRYKY